MERLYKNANLRLLWFRTSVLCLILAVTAAVSISLLRPSKADLDAESRLLGKWEVWYGKYDPTLPPDRIIEWIPDGASAHFSPGNPNSLKGCERIARHFDLVPWEEGSGPLDRLAASGVDLEDVLAVARCAQISLIAELASFFDTVSCSGPMVADASWGLFEQSDDDSPGRRIDDLHTSIFEPDVMEAVKKVPADGS